VKTLEYSRWARIEWIVETRQWRIWLSGSGLEVTVYRTEPAPSGSGNMPAHVYEALLEILALVVRNVGSGQETLSRTLMYSGEWLPILVGSNGDWIGPLGAGDGFSPHEVQDRARAIFCELLAAHGHVLQAIAEAGA
jgi:hypothetical protein